MTLYLTKSAGTRDITTILTMWTWSGDKATISRQLSGTVAYIAVSYTHLTLPTNCTV